MWTPRACEITKDTIQYKIAEGDKFVSFEGWIELMISSRAFVEFFNKVLSSNPFDGFFWEVCPVIQTALNDDFEFVIVNSLSLSNLTPDSSAFEKYFVNDALVVSFQNLGGDAQLVVPVKTSDYSDYAHLANFVRSASNEQIFAFWSRLGLEYNKRIDKKPVWLSTAGLGVSWLHIRIDTNPKYYRFTPYKTIANS